MDKHPIIVSREDIDELRMCIDFNNANDTCLKDSYPTLPVDRLVYSIAKYARLSFLDAYNGYHPIRMDLKDEEKTVFITNVGTYCYIRMSFGLKNTWATY